MRHPSVVGVKCRISYCLVSCLLIKCNMSRLLTSVGEQITSLQLTFTHICVVFERL